jgi:hypothetical protein
LLTLFFNTSRLSPDSRSELRNKTKKMISMIDIVDQSFIVKKKTLKKSCSLTPKKNAVIMEHMNNAIQRSIFLEIKTIRKSITSESFTIAISPSI